jgi:hypothetical protein
MRGALRGQYVTVVSTKRRQAKISLAPLTKFGWITGLKNIHTVKGSPSILDLVVDGVAKTFSGRPKQFNFSFLENQSHMSRPSRSRDPAKELEIATFRELPLETRTWGILTSRQLGISDEPRDILDITFLQLANQLGDLRAAIDIAVTSQSWYLGEHNGKPAFHAPQLPTSIDEAIQLVGERTLRHCGVNPDSLTYEPRIGVMIADRRGLLRLKPRTLHEYAEELGLTSERVRQISVRVKWTPSQRRWPQPQVLVNLCSSSSQYQHSQSSLSLVTEVSDEQDSTIGRLGTSDLANILVSLGARRRDVDPIGTRARQLSAMKISRAELQRRTYGFTERLGFITRTELTIHLLDEFRDFFIRPTGIDGDPQTVSESDSDDALSDLITEVCAPYKFSYGYLYVNGQRGTYFSKWVKSLLGCLGPLPFEEVYLATQRFCVVTIPRIVLPPRVVIREFLQQCPEFELEDDEVSLYGGNPYELQGREKWMYDQILSCTGRVIHRAKLFEMARKSSVPFGTISVYSAYSLYFKPVGRSCITITGHIPSDAAIELARDIGAAISVRTETRRWRVEGSCVIVEVSVGTDISHSGVWSPKANIRKLIFGTRYRVLVDGSQHGHANWSGILLAGLMTGLQVLGANIGDLVEMSFDTSAEVLELELLSGE